MYTNEIESELAIYRLTKTIGIHILDFNEFPLLPDYHNEFNMRTKGHATEFFTDLEIHTIELPKFAKQFALEGNKESVSKLLTDLDEWSAYFAYYSLLEKGISDYLHNRCVKLAFDVTKKIFLDPIKSKEFEADLRKQRDENGRILYAEKQGELKGIEEGKKEGVKEEKKNAARKMLQGKCYYSE